MTSVEGIKQVLKKAESEHDRYVEELEEANEEVDKTRGRGFKSRQEQLEDAETQKDLNVHRVEELQEITNKGFEDLKRQIEDEWQTSQKRMWPKLHLTLCDTEGEKGCLIQQVASQLSINFPLKQTKHGKKEEDHQKYFMEQATPLTSNKSDLCDTSRVPILYNRKSDVVLIREDCALDAVNVRFTNEDIGHIARRLEVIGTIIDCHNIKLLRVARGIQTPNKFEHQLSSQEHLSYSFKKDPPVGWIWLVDFLAATPEELGGVTWK
ncbi:hypothetical protein G9A89_018746 [Geosiphon pyriformis]|nr:hypothetical protein G9A89_018746 [Geosiphon pyriformis]